MVRWGAVRIGVVLGVKGRSLGGITKGKKTWGCKALMGFVRASQRSAQEYGCATLRNVAQRCATCVRSATKVATLRNFKEFCFPRELVGIRFSDWLRNVAQHCAMLRNVAQHCATLRNVE